MHTRANKPNPNEVLDEAAQMPASAKYAPWTRRRWRPRRVAAVLAVALVVGGVVYLGYRASQVLASPRIGPVEWSRVLRSATLLGLTGRLIGDPSLAVPTWTPPAVECAGSALVGSRPHDVNVSLVLPLGYDYETELLTLSFRIDNVGSRPMVVPAAAVERAHFWLINPEWECYLPDYAVGRPQGPAARPGIRVVLQPVLGAGVEVLEPGRSTTRAVAVRVWPRPPVPFNLQFCLFGSYHEFLICFEPAIINAERAPKSWEEIQDEQVKHALFAPGVPWPPRNY